MLSQRGDQPEQEGFRDGEDKGLGSFDSLRVILLG